MQLVFPTNSCCCLKNMIELILKATLFINGMLLSRIGVVYIQSPKKEILHQWGYKNEVFTDTGLDIVNIIVPLYGTALFTIGLFNLMAFFLFGIKESSYVLLATGISFWFGTNFVRSNFSKKTSNYYIKGRKEMLTLLGTCFGFACLLAGILGCTLHE